MAAESVIARESGGPAFDGYCTICGWTGLFRGTNDLQPARSFRCGGCDAQLVFQADAAAILDEFGRGRAMCLDELVLEPSFADLGVYHLGHAGPIRRRLATLADFSESSYDPERARGTALDARGRSSNQDHMQLTFPDDRFDLMVSSHVLEHVPHPEQAFREAHRVLRAGGRYIFSIPSLRLREDTLRRADLVEGSVVHHEEPRFHKSPEGAPALVFTDFGSDIVDMLDDAGLSGSIRRPHRSVQYANANCVIVATKDRAPR